MKYVNSIPIVFLFTQMKRKKKKKRQKKKPQTQPSWISCFESKGHPEIAEH